MKNFEKAKENIILLENNYSKYASFNKDAKRLKEETKKDIRSNYAKDADRILHSLSYTRYKGKTQVFPGTDNDHISKRMTHVQFVSKISRTICKALRLNEDLAEAIALGHDIGHTPIGHEGEYILDEISKKELNETFSHNIQSMRHLMEVENSGKGLNLCIQVLDGIMCHNGEMLENIYEPEEKTFEEVIRQYQESYHDIKSFKKHRPMTLEGCVVRISDIIAYIGKDIEDAIILGKLKREDLDKSITDILGNTNSEIVNTLILDIIENSMDKPYIKLSKEVFDALFKLKKFNNENIYLLSITNEERTYLKQGMYNIYNTYLSDLENNNKESVIYKIFLNYQNDKYNNDTSAKRKVIDFIAGMTDGMFKEEIKRHTKNMK